MNSEEIWYADRARLRELHQQHPEYTIPQLMQFTGRSRTFVKKRLKRFNSVPPQDEPVLWSLPRVRKNPPPHVSGFEDERVR